MGNCSSSYKVWLPGYAPDQCGAPSLEENCVKDGIQEAYRKAGKFVEKNSNCAFCTIGPDTWLKCWKSEHEPKFKKVKDNVVLHLNFYHLKIEEDSKTRMWNDCKMGEGHFYF